MKNKESMTLPMLAFTGGTKAITLTPVVGKPKQKYPEVFIPGEETLNEDKKFRSHLPMLNTARPDRLRNAECRLQRRMNYDR